MLTMFLALTRQLHSSTATTAADNFMLSTLHRKGDSCIEDLGAFGSLFVIAPWRPRPAEHKRLPRHSRQQESWTTC